MTIVNSIISWYFKKRISYIERIINSPHEVQNNVLKSLLNKAKKTEWGRKYGYSSIKNYNDFRNRLPVTEYNDIKPYVDRLIAGECNLLWPGKIKWFAKSSGTTSDRSKFIPVSIDSLNQCHYNGGRDVLTIYCHNRPDASLFNGKNLIMGGSRNINEIDKESYFGDLSAILMHNMPFWAEMMRTPGLSVALLDDWEKKLNITARLTRNQNITSISGVPSWNLVLLKKILELTGKSNILEVWPNLELFIHGGVSFTPYKQHFKKLLPTETMYYLETYNASEGFFAIQDRKDAEDMLLMLDYGVYYEFMSLEETNKESPQLINLEQVEAGKNYAMVISTNGGLWRYMIGDTVTFTDTDPYRITISGRTRNFINAFGEEVIVDNADKAILQACKETKSIIKEYTGAPIYFDEQRFAAHEYLIEFEKEPKDLQRFAELFDRELQNVNSDYEAKRSGNIMLKNLIVKSMPLGTFYQWMKKRGKIGGQNKVPRLYNSRKYVDDILAFKQPLK